MQDVPLTLPHFVERAEHLFWDKEVVTATDALDEFPRHDGKGNFLFGDLRIESLTFIESHAVESKDKYGAPGPFYNWGHFYPNPP